MRKPTGDAECPPEVLCAHEINHKLQLKVASWDLEDGEIVDIDIEDDEGDDSDDEMSDAFDPIKDDDEAKLLPCHKPTPWVCTKCVETPLLSQESTCQAFSKGTDILDKISKTFDPEIQASSMFQSHQLIVLQSQICDLNSTVLSLHSQLNDAERRYVNADHHANRL